MRIGLFGGTFDPIHEAHLVAARAAADRFGLDRVLFVPSAHPPHKAGVTHAPYEDRVRMAEIACAADPRFEVSRLEEGTERSYSIDTIVKLRETLAPGDELFFIIGADAFAEIQTWHRWREVVRSVRFVVVSRPEHRYEIPPGARVERLDDVALAISSSAVRSELAAGGAPTEIPECVREYIVSKQLYRGGTGHRVCPPEPDAVRTDPEPTPSRRL